MSLGAYEDFFGLLHEADEGIPEIEKARSEVGSIPMRFRHFSTTAG
jgi:hypothetical protein